MKILTLKLLPPHTESRSWTPVEVATFLSQEVNLTTRQVGRFLCPSRRRKSPIDGNLLLDEKVINEDTLREDFGISNEETRERILSAIATLRFYSEHNSPKRRQPSNLSLRMAQQGFSLRIDLYKSIDVASIPRARRLSFKAA